jgi:predicted DNA-binding transcriptional regulator AlpA
MKHTDSARVPGCPPIDLPPTLVSALAFDDVAGDRLNEQRYVSRRELRKLFPVSDMTIWRWQRDPQVAFPVPVKLGRNGRNFWWFPAILAWDAKRRRGSTQRAPPLCGI